MENEGKIASEKWNKAHAIPKYRQRFFNSIDWARKYSQNLYLNGKFPFQILQESLSSSKAISAIELAGGRGDFALALLDSGIAKDVHMVDISAKAVTIAMQKAEQKYKNRFSAEVQDVNKIVIEKEYDLAVFSQSLHHISELEHVLTEVKSSLKPSGVLYVSDYIGPTRMQWTDLQLKIMNQVLDEIPSSLKIELNRDGSVSEKVKEKIKRIPIEEFLRVDPSEAVRSGEIFDVLHEVFRNTQFFPLGGTITYEVFRNIAHNFVAEKEEIRALMKMVINLEYLLIEQKILKSNFGLFVCRP